MFVASRTSHLSNKYNVGVLTKHLCLFKTTFPMNSPEEAAKLFTNSADCRNTKHMSSLYAKQIKLFVSYI